MFVIRGWPRIEIIHESSIFMLSWSWFQIVLLVFDMNSTHFIHVIFGVMFLKLYGLGLRSEIVTYTSFTTDMLVSAEKEINCDNLKV